MVTAICPLCNFIYRHVTVCSFQHLQERSSSSICWANWDISDSTCCSSDCDESDWWARAKLLIDVHVDLSESIIFCFMSAPILARFSLSSETFTIPIFVPFDQPVFNFTYTRHLHISFTHLSPLLHNFQGAYSCVRTLSFFYVDLLHWRLYVNI